MKLQFNLLRKGRELILKSIDGLTLEQMHTIPEGFKNNIVWKEKALKRLTEIKRNNPSLVHLIEDGLQLFSC